VNSKKDLKNRHTDAKGVIERRVKMARREIQRVSEYEYLLVNDDLDKATDKLRLIAEIARFKKSNEEINEFVQEWEDL